MSISGCFLGKSSKRAVESHISSAVSAVENRPFKKTVGETGDRHGVGGVSRTEPVWFQPIWKILVKMGIFPK